MQLEQLTKKIQELVPEIMELKFGCQLLKKNIGVIFNIYSVVERHKSGGGYYRTELGDIKFGEIDKYKIIGRPINIEDILLADSIKRRWTGNLFIDHSGGLNGTEYHWTFGKPLHDQSEETIKFLANLLT